MSSSADRSLRPLTMCQAFGGPHAPGVWLRLWVVTLLPASLLVLLQEHAAGMTDPALLLASAVSQQLASAAVGIAIVAVARAHASGLLTSAVFGGWTLIGILRGVTGDAIAVASGLASALPLRVLFWLLVCWTWMPILGWLVAQTSLRRRLHDGFTRAAAERDSSRVRAVRSAEEVRSLLLSSVTGTVIAAVREIRDGLNRLSPSDAHAMAGIGERLTALTAQVTAAVDKSADAPARAERTMAPPRVLEVMLHVEARQRTAFAAFTGGAVLSVLLPVSLLAGRPLLAFNTAIAVLAGVAVLLLASWGRRVGPEHTLARTAARHVIAASSSGIILLALEKGHLQEFDLLVGAVLMIGFFLAAVLVTAAVGSGSTNRAVIGVIANTMAERTAFEETAKREEEKAKAELQELIHGPVQGRLAACAMAINFHATGGTSAHPTAVVTAVLAHLALVEDDLALMTSSPTRAAAR